MSLHSRLRFCILSVLLLAGTAFSVQAQSDRIALVTEIKGTVELAKAGSSSYAKIDWGTPLFEGDRVRTAAGSEAVVLFSNSNMLTVRAGNTYTVTAGNAATSLSGPVRAVDGDLMAAASDLTLHRAGQGEIEVLGGLRSGGDDSAISLTFPRNSKISSSNPVFSWDSSEDFESFTVVVRSDAGEIWSGSTEDLTLEYPSDAPVLEAGKNYFWQVKGEDMLDVFSSPLVSFEVVSDKEMAQIEDGKTQISALFENQVSNSGQLFMIGSMQVKYGLLGEAISTFTKISEANPTSPAVHEILGKLYYEIGLKDEAVIKCSCTFTLTVSVTT